jgi:UDP:flavonoid glycosyltransferase YjiC (YdhE family)
MTRRVLFVAEAVTLAHVGRAVALARCAADQGFDVLVACDPRYRWVVDGAGLPWRPVNTIVAGQFARALRSGAPIYSVNDLLAYVQEEEALMRDFHPDIAVGDFRLSLPAAARLQGVASINVVNAYWSPQAPKPTQIPDIPVRRLLGLHAGKWAFSACYPIVTRMHAAPVVKLFKRLGLGRVPPDLQHAYCQGDFLAHPDMPHLFPSIAPDHFLGPVGWQPRVALPESVQQRSRSGQPLVYLNLGSSGAIDLLPEILRALAGLDVQVVAVTAGRTLACTGALPANVLMLDYAPGDAMAALASLVICNGGSLGCHQALSHGVPVVAIPTNLDQCLNAQALQGTRAVQVVRTGLGFTHRIRSAVDQLLQDGRWSDAARGVAARASSGELPTRLRRVFDAVLSGSCA